MSMNQYHYLGVYVKCFEPNKDTNELDLNDELIRVFTSYGESPYDVWISNILDDNIICEEGFWEIDLRNLGMNDKIECFKDKFKNGLDILNKNYGDWKVSIGYGLVSYYM